MANAFSTTPKTVPAVSTANRTIKTQIPVPESLPVIEKLRKYEPISMSGQPLVLWDKGDGATVFDKWGNSWIDWSSGVLITNSGHNNPKIRRVGPPDQLLLPQLRPGQAGRVAGGSDPQGTDQGIHPHHR